MFPWTTQAGRSWLIPGNVSITPDPTFVNYDSSKRSKIALVSDGGLFLLCSWNDPEQFLLSTECRDSLLAVGDDQKNGCLITLVSKVRVNTYIASGS